MKTFFADLGDCRYKGYRDRDGHQSIYYYQLLGAKLAFVIAFEVSVVVSFVTDLVIELFQCLVSN